MTLTTGGRRYWLLSFVAVAALVVGNWWLNHAWQPELPAPPADAQRIDYALDDFRAQFHDAEGTQTLAVSGPRLEHDAQTREARITAPRFAIDPDGQAWSGRARRARIDRDAQQLKLYGQVRIERPHPRGTIRISSDEMHYDRAAGTLHSPGPAHMAQAGTRLTGGTLTAWIDDEFMELDQDVHAIYRAGGAAARD
ncbi:MAG: LPS export ABC transporter periplasmic protein LptC [Wenzhouxiangellaceae bacterium]|nr:LPS export ABC transporter periplasmic protein LptC [Wenzhouxiangellaceae bacterium]MBS3824242.1 LPS export ABC transporter periplasmic protein LptC [Wenzhouxiangellaceae bacterium]